MPIDTIPQGNLALLDHAVVRELLRSAIPARLGYIAVDGTPRVTPIWFTWNGHEFVLGASGISSKVKALRENPYVALTIDTETAPYRALSVRGEARVEIVEGAVEEYAKSALRYLGPEAGARFRDHAMASLRGMARITVRPDWVGLIDFETRFPADYRNQPSDEAAS